MKAKRNKEQRSASLFITNALCAVFPDGRIRDFSFIPHHWYVSISDGDGNLYTVLYKNRLLSVQHLIDMRR